MQSRKRDDYPIGKHCSVIDATIGKDARKLAYTVASF